MLSYSEKPRRRRRSPAALVRERPLVHTSRSSYEYSDDVYVKPNSSIMRSQPKTMTSKLYSADNNTAKLVAETDYESRDSKRDPRRERAGYHRMGPQSYNRAPLREISESDWSYTDPAGMFNTTEPMRQQRPRRASVDASERRRSAYEPAFMLGRVGKAQDSGKGSMQELSRLSLRRAEGSDKRLEDHKSPKPERGFGITPPASTITLPPPAFQSVHESIHPVAGEDRSVRFAPPAKNSGIEVKAKGILRKPTEAFPENPVVIREGIAPRKSQANDDKSIPQGAKWTKIDRRLVNPQALEESGERFEERQEHVIVLRVLTKVEIQKLADRTSEIRGTSFVAIIQSRRHG